MANRILWNWMVSVSFLLATTARATNITCPSSRLIDGGTTSLEFMIKKDDFTSPSPCLSPPTSVTFHVLPASGVTSQLLCSVNYDVCPTQGSSEKQHCNSCSCKCERDDGTYRVYHLYYPVTSLEGGNIYLQVNCKQSETLPVLLNRTCDDFTIKNAAASTDQNKGTDPQFVGIVIAVAVGLMAVVAAVLVSVIYNRKKPANRLKDTVLTDLEEEENNPPERNEPTPPVVDFFPVYVAPYSPEDRDIESVASDKSTDVEGSSLSSGMSSVAESLKSSSASEATTLSTVSDEDEDRRKSPILEYAQYT